MKLAASFLSIKDNLKENIKKLDSLHIDYLHLDIMDGVFVPNKTWNIDEMKELIKNHTKPLDVHLMVKDIYKYIDDFQALKPKYITFHYEITSDPYLIIDYIKSYGVKVGISINPETDFSAIEYLLDDIDLVLIMSVNPGLGGQVFIENTYHKIKQAKELQKKHHYLIEVDGGINDTNIDKINSDIVVVGSFITNGDYQAQINKIKN